MPKLTTKKKINGKKTTPDASNPSTTDSAILVSIPSCSHGAAIDNDTSSNNDNTSGNGKSSKLPKLPKLPKLSTSRPCEPDSVGTSLCIATQLSLQESILEMPKILRTKSKAGGGGGSANVNLGDEDSVGGGVGWSRKVATTRGRAQG